ncbi:MAG: hypothetical protein JWO82_2493 [Akkermansiaceae bacterium]|nr:hypothetical protein [Akkermansiaceae bacterium]
MKTDEILTAIQNRKPTPETKKKAAAQRADWFRFENSADSKTLTLYLYDVIGLWFLETDAKTFATALSQFTGDNIVVRINSPGGSVFEGFAIYNLLRDHPANVTVKVDGLAASIASVIAMAGDQIEIADNGFFMIHNPSGAVYGQSKDLRATADVLDQLKVGILSAYGRSSVPVKDLEAYMDAESWFDATDSVAKGFATKKAVPIKATALWNPAEFEGLPEGAAALAYREEEETPDPPEPEPEPAAGGTVEDVQAAAAFLATVRAQLDRGEDGYGFN